MELSKRDGQGSFYRAQCKILNVTRDFKALVVFNNESYNVICVAVPSVDDGSHSQVGGCVA